MSWTVSVLAMKNLMLDLYELNKFEKAGFDRNEIKWNGQMATALHSCGSQLGPCPCGCRLHAFTEESLTKGGLHGLLVRLAGFAKCGHTLYPSCRHVHPDELALLNGMLPGYEWENPKMALCALGQLASPLQSVWLGAHIMQHVHKVFGSCDDITPETLLFQYMDRLLTRRDQVFGIASKPSTKMFQQMVQERVFDMPNPIKSAQHAGDHEVHTGVKHESMPGVPTQELQYQVPHDPPQLRNQNSPLTMPCLQLHMHPGLHQPKHPLHPHPLYRLDQHSPVCIRLRYLRFLQRVNTTQMTDATPKVLHHPNLPKLPHVKPDLCQDRQACLNKPPELWPLRKTIMPLRHPTHLMLVQSCALPEA